MKQQSSARPVILVLEDEAMIAVNLQDELQDAGYRVAGPFTSCADALAWLRSATPDTAILDTTLKDGSCQEIARELSRRDIPFLIYSGHRKDRELLSDLHHVSWFEKPVSPSVLVQACQRLLIGSDQ
jgi:DNA-binding response OmpR family regulator